MGSRFEHYPEDLQILNNNTDLNISSAKACFAKAAEYARNVILESGASPLTEKQWFGGDNYNDGFNDISSPSWIWGGILTSEQAGVAGQWICLQVILSRTIFWCLQFLCSVQSNKQKII